MTGFEDKALQAKLQEAQHNMEYAESDESGGFHNHNYIMALLNDSNDNALEILAALEGPITIQEFGAILAIAGLVAVTYLVHQTKKEQNEKEIKFLSSLALSIFLVISLDFGGGHTE